MVALIQRPAEPREFADDEAVAALEGAREFVEPPAVAQKRGAWLVGLNPTAAASAASTVRGGRPSLAHLEDG